MMLWLGIIAAFLLALGEAFVIAAAGTFKRGLEWPDYVALVATIMLAVFFIFLPWPVALALSIAVLALTVWGVSSLLKVPTKRQVR
jgi:chromate transport protein ChrA